MRNFLAFLTLVVFSMSPAAFGGGLSAADIYKNTYISMKKGKSSAEVFNNLLAQTQASGLSVKDVMEAAVAKGYVSQEQMNSVLDLAAKNANLVNDKSFVEKVKAGKITQADMQKFQDAIQGQISGAAYWCDRYGCYHSYYDPTVTILVIVLIVLIVTPVVVVVH